MEQQPANGAWLREHRELATPHLTLTEVADRAGLSKSYLSDLERGRRTLHPHMVIRVVEAIHDRRRNR